MMVYEKALKLIALLEHPQPDHMDDDDYQVAIEECVAAKFRYLGGVRRPCAHRKGAGVSLLPKCTDPIEREPNSNSVGMPELSNFF